MVATGRPVAAASAVERARATLDKESYEFFYVFENANDVECDVAVKSIREEERSSPRQSQSPIMKQRNR